MFRNLLFILPFTFLSFSTIEDTNWKIEKEKNGIIVYSQIAENSNLKEIRMTSSVKATLSEAVAILLDVENYNTWIYNCKKAKVIKRNEQNDLIYYSVTKAPWPIEDRDLVVNNKIFQHKDSKAVFSLSETVTDMIKPIDGKVRIVDMYGLWKFTPKGNGEIGIEYYIRVDPAGKLPRWVINMFIANGPYQTMLNFKERLKVEKYQDAQFDFIEN